MIFLNYRPQDADVTTGRLIGHLERTFSPTELVIDAGGGPPGVNIFNRLELLVRKCQVFLAVIGPNWLSVQDRQGRRRIDRDNDLVRLQIEAALYYRKLLIPVLVDAADQPTGADLPVGIRMLARLNPVALRSHHFAADLRALVDYIDDALDDPDGEFGATEEWEIDDIQRLKLWSRPRPDEVPQTTIQARLPTEPALLPRTVLDNPPLLPETDEDVEPTVNLSPDSEDLPRFDGRVSPKHALLVINDDTIIDVVKRRLGSRLIKKVHD